MTDPIQLNQLEPGERFIILSDKSRYPTKYKLEEKESGKCFNESTRKIEYKSARLLVKKLQVK